MQSIKEHELFAVLEQLKNTMTSLQAKNETQQQLTKAIDALDQLSTMYLQQKRNNRLNQENVALLSSLVQALKVEAEKEQGQMFLRPIQQTLLSTISHTEYVIKQLRDQRRKVRGAENETLRRGK